MVPRPAQREVTGAWKAYSRARQSRNGLPKAYRDYLIARKAAVDFVNGRLSKA
jgi:hypothetical protein